MGEHDKVRQVLFQLATVVSMGHKQTDEAGRRNGSCSCRCTCGKKPAPLFADDTFPARWNVLPNSFSVAAWLRPHEIRKEPCLFVEGCSRLNVQQGRLGDCSFLAACAALAERPDLLKKVIPEGQVLFGDGYDGSVLFRLWHQGTWHEVRIDDRLPVDATGTAIYARCPHPDAFWVPLLEKAFAKFHKHFGALHGGLYLDEGIVNLTGYSTHGYELEGWNTSKIGEVFQKINTASKLGGLIVCSIADSAPGIPGGHCYTVTRVFERIPKKEDEEHIQLVRVRNPWGTEIKWNGGAWKDGDDSWKKLDKDVAKSLRCKSEDGEFWMSIHDFVDLFEKFLIATENPDGAENMKMVGQITGKWSSDYEKGGHPNDLEKFARNPQFLLVVLGALELENQEEKINIMDGVDSIVELMKAHCRKEESDSCQIAFYMFETDTERSLSAEEMKQLTYVTGSTEFLWDLHVSCHVRLRPGRRYVIVPSRKSPGQSGDFLLRVFSRHARVRLTRLQD